MTNPGDDRMIDQLPSFFHIEQGKYPGDDREGNAPADKIRKGERRFNEAPQCPGIAVFFYPVFDQDGK